MTIWLSVGASVAAAVFAGYGVLIQLRARRPILDLTRSALSRGTDGVRLDVLVQNTGEVPCSIRRIDVLVDGTTVEGPVLSIGGADALALPLRIPVGHGVTISIGLRAPDIDLPPDVRIPPLLGRGVTVRVWVDRRRKFELDIAGAPLSAIIITRVLNNDATVAHDCVQSGCAVSWNGCDLMTGERVAGAGPLPAEVIQVDDHTVRFSADAEPAA
jgi:hypothetical protein